MIFVGIETFETNLFSSEWFEWIQPETWLEIEKQPSLFASLFIYKSMTGIYEINNSTLKLDFLLRQNLWYALTFSRIKQWLFHFVK